MHWSLGQRVVVLVVGLLLAALFVAVLPWWLAVFAPIVLVPLFVEVLAP